MQIFKTRVSLAASNRSIKLTEGYLKKERFEKPPVIENKHANSLYTSAIFAKKSRAQNVQPTELGFLVYDIDSKEGACDGDQVREQVKQLIKTISQDHGLEYVTHTTYSHKAAAPRYRLILALSRTVTPEEYPVVWDGVMQAFDIPADLGAAAVKQLMYQPAINPDAEAEDCYRYMMGEGAALVPDEFLSAKQIGAVQPTEEENDLLDVYQAMESGPMVTPPCIDEHDWVRTILSLMSPIDMLYDDWVVIINAVAHQLEHAPEGIDILINWSYAKGKNDKHIEGNDKTIAYKYRKEGREKNPKTLRSLLNAPSTRKTTTMLCEAYRLLLDAASSEQELAEIFDFIKADTYLNKSNDIGRITTRYISQYKAVVPDAETDPITRVEVRNLLTGKAPVDAPDVDQLLADSFYDKYVVQQWDDLIREVGTEHTMSMRAFNIMHRTNMPVKRDGLYPVPMEVLQQGLYGFKPLRFVVANDYQVDGPMLIDKNGKWYINQYVPGSFPQPDIPFNEDDPLDAEVKDYVTRHMDLLGNGDPLASDAILKWLAHMRQHPHIRQTWGVSILSAYQGIGKTFYKTLCQSVLGEEQVASISPQQANDKFNEWKVAPKLVSFLDEPDDYGNVKDARVNVDFFKEFMTSSTETIRRQRTEWKTASLHTRLAITSNNVHTMGNEMGGRRWLTSIIERGSQAHMSRVYNREPRSYFNRYGILLADHAERVAAYFDSIDLDGFPIRETPITLQGGQAVNNTFPELTATVLRQLLQTKTHHDVGELVVLKPVLREVIKGMAMDDDPDLVRLAIRSDGKLNQLIESALYETGYVPLTRERSVRVRLPFESAPRAQLSHIWVTEAAKPKGKEPLKQFVTRLLEDQKAMENVIDMFPDGKDGEQAA